MNNYSFLTRILNKNPVNRMNPNVIFIISIISMILSILNFIGPKYRTDTRTDEISYISGYVINSCKYLDEVECSELIEWGKAKIDDITLFYKRF